MKKVLPLVFTVLTSAQLSSALADDSWYLGTLYNAQEISMHGRDFNTAGIVAGYEYDNYFSVETRLSKGISGYSSFYGTPEEPWGSYKEDIDKQYSLLIKASYPILDSLKFYGLAGYASTKVEMNGLGQVNDSNSNIIGNYPYTRTETQNGITYGVGVNFQINEQFNIFVDYQVLPDFEPSTNFSKNWKSTSIGVNYFF